MLQIISHTPTYVWFLLGYLLWGGWKARKTHIVSWKAIVIMPAVMFIWSAYGFFAHYKAISLLLWVVSLTVGIWVGSLTIRRIELRFDKQRKLIEITGHWTSLFLSLSIFFLRYFLGVASEFPLALKSTIPLLVIENIATMITGMFAGRLIGYWQRSKISSHVNLAEQSAYEKDSQESLNEQL